MHRVRGASGGLRALGPGFRPDLNEPLAVVPLRHCLRHPAKADAEPSSSRRHCAVHAVDRWWKTRGTKVKDPEDELYRGRG